MLIPTTDLKSQPSVQDRDEKQKTMLIIGDRMIRVQSENGMMC